MTYQQSLLDALSAALPRLDWATHGDLAISGTARGVLVGIQWESPDLSAYRVNFSRHAAARDVRPVMVVGMAVVGCSEQEDHYDRHLEPGQVAQAVTELAARINQWAAGAALAAALTSEAIQP